MSLSQQKLGFHYYPDTDHYSQSDLDTWLPVLHSAGANWLTLRTSATAPVPIEFLTGITSKGIQPIIHIADPVGSLRMAQIYTNLKIYADCGIEYVIFFDRPNMRSAWPASSWSHESLISRFVDTLLPILEAQIELGMNPILPPLEPGGDYWDTAFLETSLALIHQRTSDLVREQLMLSLYMWTYGKSLDWGQGGQAAWPEARPYRSPAGSQDQRGFQIHDWYQEIAEHVFGRRIPTLVIAGGAGSSQTYQDPKSLQIANNEVARHLAEHGIADEILNFNFYPLATAENHQDFPASWYTLPAEKSDGAKVIAEADEARIHPQTVDRAIDHYILIGLTNRTNGMKLWNAIAPPVMGAKATVGFSLDEAKRAARVSILADYEALPPSVDDELRAAGSMTERYENWDSDDFLLAASSWAAKTEVTGVEDD